ncbi:DUF1223 domain-containing protein [Methyloraptor flagellatus]|uniref:DUF1223 domain-containing protein n=1 Tax=Methyloraptor flagellatus TaxID=3162530 RepID=A0AAU7XD10_9HYPH
MTRLSTLALAGAALLGAVAPAAAERPVVVELFTSQGCSSCPPADRFLTELSRERSDVLPLAFHVTYWNGLGWTDPFSFEAATRRQAAYGARFGDGSYTPEMVIDGRLGVVGSDRLRATAAIEAARAAQSAAPDISVRRGRTGVEVRVGAGEGAGRVVLVGYDRQHETSIGRGENRGRTLTESNIVRSFVPVGTWTGARAAFEVPVPPGEAFAVLVERDGGGILGAARAEPVAGH